MFELIPSIAKDLPVLLFLPALLIPLKKLFYSRIMLEDKKLALNFIKMEYSYYYILLLLAYFFAVGGYIKTELVFISVYIYWIPIYIIAFFIVPVVKEYAFFKKNLKECNLSRLEKVVILNNLIQLFMALGLAFLFSYIYTYFSIRI